MPKKKKAKKPAKKKKEIRQSSAGIPQRGDKPRRGFGIPQRRTR